MICEPKSLFRVHSFYFNRLFKKAQPTICGMGGQNAGVCHVNFKSKSHGLAAAPKLIDDISCFYHFYQKCGSTILLNIVY